MTRSLHFVHLLYLPFFTKPDTVCYYHDLGAQLLYESLLAVFSMRILMLHGYAQSGELYRRKTTGLVHRIRQVHPNATFLWPNGPIELKTTDIPAWDPKRYTVQSEDGPELRAWFQHRYVLDPPSGLSASLSFIANILQDEGPFDGVIAFSQGTVIAGMIASLLEGDATHNAYSKSFRKSPIAFEYPTEFLKIQHPPLRFGILYASRVGQHECYDWLYETPRVRTPLCLIFGRLDPMIECDERDAAIRRLMRGNDSCLWFHDGGHYVPTDALNLDRAINFICNTSARQRLKKDKTTFNKHKRIAIDADDLRTRLENLAQAESCPKQPLIHVHRHLV